MTGPTPYTPPDGHILIATDGHIMPTELDGWEIANALYELRPIRQPNPKWIDLDGQVAGVTTVGEMRDRTDLDQWEYADPWDGDWRPVTDRISPQVAVPDGLPIIVRRKTEDGGS